MDTKLVTVGAHVFAVDVFGTEGPPLVLLHGIPGFRGNWRGVAEALAPRHRVFVPDLLGFGESTDPDPADFHARGHAAALLGLLDALGLPRVHVGGFDFGGPIAIELARIAAPRLSSITLIATNAFTDTKVPLPLRIARVPWLGALFFRLAFGRLGTSVLWRAAVADRVAFPYERYRQVLRFARGLAWTQKIFLASLRDLPGLYGPIEQTLAALQMPSLVLWGDRDPFFGVEVGERTARVAGARFELFRGAGHFVPEERPEQVARAMAALT